MKAVASAVFVVALIHCEVSNPESDRYCCIEQFVKKVHDLNLSSLTMNLLYGLLFETSDSLLANTLSSLNYVIKLLLEQPNRVSVIFVNYILLFVFIYDSNIKLVPTASALRRGDRESLVNVLPMKTIESLIHSPFDLVANRWVESFLDGNRVQSLFHLALPADWLWFLFLCSTL